MILGIRFVGWITVQQNINLFFKAWTFSNLFWKFSFSGLSHKISPKSRWGLISDLYVVNEAFLETLTESPLIRPINLLHFLIFWSTWNLKSRFESKTMPKCLWWGYFLMTLLLKATGRREMFFVFLEKITSFVCLF